MYLKHRPQLQIITTLVTVLFANHSHELLPSLRCHLPLWDIYVFTMVCFIFLLFGCWSVSGLLWVFFIFESMNWCNNYLFLKFERKKNHFFLRNTREVIVPSESASRTYLKILKISSKRYRAVRLHRTCSLLVPRKMQVRHVMLSWEILIIF